MNISATNFNSFLGTSKNLRGVDLRRIDYTDVPTNLSQFRKNDYRRHDLRTSVNTFKHAVKLKRDEEGFPVSKRKYYHSVYELPIAFALETLERNRRGKDTHIVEEIPDMLKDIDEDELLETLDMAAVFTDDDVDDIKFEIEGKEFELEQVESGSYGIAYKLKRDGFDKPLLFKVYRDANRIDYHGIFAEVALERELNHAGVIDIPKLYMASPLGKEIKMQGENKTYIHATWKISEFVDEDTPLKEGDLTLEKYLKRKRLTHDDMHEGNKIGDYIVDLGGVINKDLRGTCEVYGYHNLDWLNRMLCEGKSTEEILSKIKR